MSTDKMVGY